MTPRRLLLYKSRAISRHNSTCLSSAAENDNRPASGGGRASDARSSCRGDVGSPLLGGKEKRFCIGLRRMITPRDGEALVKARPSMSTTLAPLVRLVACEACGGTGGNRMSRGNDPLHMIETGRECLVCEGNGEFELPIMCEGCGEPAIVIQAMLCLCELCARERREGEPRGEAEKG